MYFLRNALAYANKSQRQMVFALINTIFAQEAADAAHGQWRVVADQLREKLPKLAMMMDAAEHEVLTFMDFPKRRAPCVRSTAMPTWRARNAIVIAFSSRETRVARCLRLQAGPTFRG